MSADAGLLSAAAATAVLALLHTPVPPLRHRIGSMAEGIVASIGGGIASAYVFVHLLPELARGNEEMAEVLGEHYGERFARTGRVVLVSALAVGYLLAWAFAPTSTTVVTTLLALLGGFVLYNVFADELPGDRRLRFPVFAGSATAYAAVLVAVTAAS